MPRVNRILAINPGSTSTKIGLFEDESEIFKTSIEHPASLIAEFPTIEAQYEMRKEAVLACLKGRDQDPATLDALAARGGPLPQLAGGAYRVDAAMVDALRHGSLAEHVSNLAGIIAYDIGEARGIPSYIYDAISADELSEVARISGMPAIPRRSLCHVLNMRSVGRKVAQGMGRAYGDVNLIVAHLGGGISISLHRGGKMEDIVGDDEGPFSPERAGRVPCRALIDLCYSGEHDHQTMRRMLRGKGGLVAYAGTNDVVEMETRIDSGNIEASLLLEAMAYQVAKGIGELATVVRGRVDRIVLTGGIARSKRIVSWIAERVGFIAPVEIVPGENELEALAFGVLRVLRGQEEARLYAPRTEAISEGKV
ncbi:MAG: butyrate kinase [Spirochaetaceae bacterium]|nr:butyrate kinase [Spirochaetaceae bacterium]